MKITSFTQKINDVTPLKVAKLLSDSGKVEHYELLKSGEKVCSFDFTNYKGIEGYFSHGEVQNFELAMPFRRKKLGAKAILQAKSIIQDSAKEKHIKFVMFNVSKKLPENVRKVMEHLGCIEYNIDDLASKNYILLIEPKFLKNLRRRLFRKIPKLSSAANLRCIV